MCTFSHTPEKPALKGVNAAEPRIATVFPVQDTAADCTPPAAVPTRWTTQVDVRPSAALTHDAAMKTSSAAAYGIFVKPGSL